MKKRRFAALTILAPLLLLCACGGGTPALNLSANWYSDTTAGSNIDGTYERLEYSVSFTSASSSAAYRVEYGTGSYVVTLGSEPYSDENGTSETVYRLRTEFSITGKFYYGSVEGEQFEDSTVSNVLFRNVETGLRPIESTKTVKSHLPINQPSAEKMCGVYDYTYSFLYDEGLGSATYTFTNETPGEEADPAQTSVSLGGSGTYLDNEQIFFALRGLELNAAAQFRSVDPQTRQCVSVSVSQGTSGTTTAGFSLLDRSGNETGRAEGEIRTKTCTLSYSTAQPGPGRTLVFAAKTSTEDNTYRNVLLRIEYDIMNSMGTMKYDLVKATFTDR